MGLQSVEFDLCIVDEASKATPTETLVPLAKSKRWVVVGDSKQLPPYVGDILENPRLLEQFGLDRDDVKETLLDLSLIHIFPPPPRRMLNDSLGSSPGAPEIFVGSVTRLQAEPHCGSAKPQF